ncbi:hypothetical protein EV714DRAFT_255817 [Schizophyllum commune]
MTSFADLLQLAHTQTQQAENQVQAVLAERKRKEAEKRKQEEERARKERELEKQRIQRKLNEERREQERRQRQEEEQAAKEAARRRREEEAREQVLHGLKRGTSTTKRQRLIEEDEDGASSSRASSAVPLTREEKRERKMQAELRKAYGLPKSTKKGAGYSKYGARLPGGAMDIVDNGDAAGPPGMSTKQRLLSTPIGLTKVYQNKRDTRTTSEIIEAKQQPHTLNGEDARHFNDWFGSGKDARGSGSASRALLSGKKSMSSLPPSQSTSSKSLSAPRAGQQKPSTSSAARQGQKPMKRPRLPAHSEYDSEPDEYRKPRKRRPFDDEDPLNVQEEIWRLFGKDRGRYVNRDVESDDDMEADAMAVEREEKLSARFAKEEDQRAAEEERRHEEEKRRRKLMKEKEKRGKA